MLYHHTRSHFQLFLPFRGACVVRCTPYLVPVHGQCALYSVAGVDGARFIPECHSNMLHVPQQTFHITKHCYSSWRSLRHEIMKPVGSDSGIALQRYWHILSIETIQRNKWSTSANPHVKRMIFGSSNIALVE